MKKLRNPIIPGFNPDPSVCEHDGWYYIVTSSFEYFPSIPIYRSKDFANWEHIGYCIDRASQLDLTGVRDSQGVYAATIRCHAGLFYVVTTLVQEPEYIGSRSFFVTANDPAGPWSDPVWIEGSVGIDPTLYFDINGLAYYVGNRRPSPEDRIHRSIWIQRIDLSTGKLFGDSYTLLTDGAVHGAMCPEAPHIYYVNGLYYLLIAEGGTYGNHAVSVFRSEHLLGPYECNPRNPVLTHRTMSRNSSVACTGHADLIQLNNGRWWAVLLATRPNHDSSDPLGRETFAVPLIWEDGWPVFCPETGSVQLSYDSPIPDGTKPVRRGGRAIYPGEWLFIRGLPYGNTYTDVDTGMPLIVRGNESLLTEEKTPACYLRKLDSKRWEARASLKCECLDGDAAGCVIRYNTQNHVRFDMIRRGSRYTLRIIDVHSGVSKPLFHKDVCDNRLKIVLKAEEAQVTFTAADGDGNTLLTAETIDISHLCAAVSGGFTGALAGFFCEGAGSVLTVEQFVFVRT